MANRQRAEARRKAAAKAARSEGGGSKVWLWSGVGAIVAIALIVVVAITAGGSSTASDTTAPGSTVDTSFPDSQKVTITGDKLPAYAEGGTDDAVGMTAPSLSGFNFQGDEIVIDPAANGPYMLVFLAHWCPHCNAEVPRLLDWKNSGAVPAELNVVGIATAVASTAANYPPARWFETKGWSWPVLVDEKVDDGGTAGLAAQAFGASGWPYLVIIGEDGTVKARSSGELTIDQINTFVTDALAS